MGPPCSEKPPPPWLDRSLQPDAFSNQALGLRGAFCSSTREPESRSAWMTRKICGWGGALAWESPLQVLRKTHPPPPSFC